MENDADKKVEAENSAEQTAEKTVQDKSPVIEDSVCEDGISEGGVLADHPDNTSMEDNGVADNLPTDEKYKREIKNESEPPQDRIELVAIPFINDGASNIQIFYNSMFHKEGDTDAIFVAERYFFNCFNNDDVPKWDGVLLCQYNFTKDGIIKDDRNGFVRLRDFKSKWLWNVQHGTRLHRKVGRVPFNDGEIRQKGRGHGKIRHAWNCGINNDAVCLSWKCS